MKNKKIACLAVAGVLALSGGSYYAGVKSSETSLTVGAASGTYEFLTYEIWTGDLDGDNVDDEYIVIRSCNQNANGDIIVPDYIDGVPVVKLVSPNSDDGVFKNRDMITSVTLPERIKSIPAYTFSGCKSLKSVSMADDVSSIGGGAFKDCKSLKSVTIKDKYCSISDDAFDGISTNTVFYGYVNSTLEGFCQRKGFTFKDVESGEVVKEPLFGDIDGDGLIDAGDASIILSYYVYLQTGGEKPLTDMLVEWGFV